MKMKSNDKGSLAFLRVCRGQVMTMLPFLTGPLLYRFPRGRQEYQHSFIDPDRGEINIYGDRYYAQEGKQAKTLRVLVHGLSSNHRSYYLAPHVQSALKAGDDALTLALRGALGLGTDHYHAGLTEDLHEVFNDARFSQYKEIVVIGFSLGGLVVLNFHLECQDDRLLSTVALCAPVNLAEVQAHLDRRAQTIYRHIVLRSLKIPYLSLWKRSQKSKSALKADLKRVLSAKTFEEWDKAVVITRFDFTSTQEYHERVSVSQESLSSKMVPSLVVFERADPMVPYHLLGYDEEQSSQFCTVRVSDGGGHISFSKGLDLGFEGALGITDQINSWIHLQRQSKQDTVI